MITDEQLQEWGALADAATRGPWSTISKFTGPYGEGVGGTAIIGAYDSEWIDLTIAVCPPRNAEMADAAFLVAARTAVPALIGEVERLQVAWSAEHDAYIRADEQARMAKRDADELRGEVRELQNRLSAADPDIVWID